jgi:hypothetical protein
MLNVSEYLPLKLHAVNFIGVLILNFSENLQNQNLAPHSLAF